MAIDLGKPLAWTKATVEEHAMLADLQGNILKSHGRHAALHIFFRFGTDVARSRMLVRRLGALTISALDQLHSTETRKQLNAADLPLGTTPTFYSLLLTSDGYAALDRSNAAPADDAFVQGMHARANKLNDTGRDLDPDWAGARPHAMLLIAADPDDADTSASRVLDFASVEATTIIVSLGGQIVQQQPGHAIHRTQPGGGRDVIEHFGYIDGRSQPLFLEESLADERAIAGDDKWNPRSNLSQLLVRDPGAANDAGYGSFFVFRKLEQDVDGFKVAEEALEVSLGVVDLPGAMIVGRFEDGTPVVESNTQGTGPRSNNFNYDTDIDGARCPLHAHVRKTNPRGDSVRAGLATPDDEHGRLMARRGITYGDRDRIVDPTDRPSKGVGLLFMSYQASLTKQFEFTQQTWANNPAFVHGGVGADPVIGQPLTELSHPRIWGDAAAGRHTEAFGGHVRFKGGDYFFAPARSTLLSM